MKPPKTACGLASYTQIWWGDSGYHGGDEMKAPAVGKPLEDGMANQLPNGTTIDASLRPRWPR